MADQAKKEGLVSYKAADETRGLHSRGYAGIPNAGDDGADDWHLDKKNDTNTQQCTSTWQHATAT